MCDILPEYASYRDAYRAADPGLDCGPNPSSIVNQERPKKIGCYSDGSNPCNWTSRDFEFSQSGYRAVASITKHRLGHGTLTGRPEQLADLIRDLDETEVLTLEPGRPVKW